MRLNVCNGWKVGVEVICVCGWMCRYCVRDVIIIKMSLMKIPKKLVTLSCICFQVCHIMIILLMQWKQVTF